MRMEVAQTMSKYFFFLFFIIINICSGCSNPEHRSIIPIIDPMKDALHYKNINVDIIKSIYENKPVDESIIIDYYVSFWICKMINSNNDIIYQACKEALIRHETVSIKYIYRFLYCNEINDYAKEKLLSILVSINTDDSFDVLYDYISSMGIDYDTTIPLDNNDYRVFHGIDKYNINMKYTNGKYYSFRPNKTQLLYTIKPYIAMKYIINLLNNNSIDNRVFMSHLIISTYPDLMKYYEVFDLNDDGTRIRNVFNSIEIGNNNPAHNMPPSLSSTEISESPIPEQLQKTESEYVDEKDSENENH